MLVRHGQSDPDIIEYISSINCFRVWDIVLYQNWNRAPPPTPKAGQQRLEDAKRRATTILDSAQEALTAYEHDDCQAILRREPNYVCMIIEDKLGYLCRFNDAYVRGGESGGLRPKDHAFIKSFNDFQAAKRVTVGHPHVSNRFKITRTSLRFSLSLIVRSTDTNLCIAQYVFDDGHRGGFGYQPDYFPRGCLLQVR